MRRTPLTTKSRHANLLCVRVSAAVVYCRCRQRVFLGVFRTRVVPGGLRPVRRRPEQRLRGSGQLQGLGGRTARTAALLARLPAMPRVVLPTHR